MIWTTQQDATLKSMWAMGRAMHEIGEFLGRSRNAVAGRIKRLGIQRKGNRKEIVLIVPRAVVIDLKEGKYAFSELEANQCRYPMGRFWCGEDCEGSWCDRHRETVFAPVSKPVALSKRQMFGDSQ